MYTNYINTEIFRYTPSSYVYKQISLTQFLRAAIYQIQSTKGMYLVFFLFPIHTLMNVTLNVSCLKKYI